MSKTHVFFILDETGSMDLVKSATVSGFNEYIETLRSSDNADQIYFSLTKFNSDKVQLVHEALPIGQVPKLESYRPSALTPLYDVIGRTIVNAQNSLNNNNDRILVVIQTDGIENASREYTSDAVFRMIEEKKRAGNWTFVFLGADQDAYLASSSLGIPRGNTMSYKSVETRRAFNDVANSTVAYAAAAAPSSEDFFEEEE